MNELQKYVASLQEQGLGKEEIKAKIKEWKLANQPLEKKEEDKSLFKDDGSLNVDNFSDDTKEIARKTNEASKKEKDSANAIPVVESDKKNTESAPVDTSSGSYFTKRDGEVIFDLEAFGSEESRNIARQSNLPENDKTYNIGAGAYKVNYNADGKVVFYSKPIGASDWSSAEEDPLRTATIAQILGIGDPNFNIDDYDIEIPELQQPEEEDDDEDLVMGSENIKVEIPLIVENKSKYKINGTIYTHQHLDNKIRNNDKGFEKINSVKEYLNIHKKRGSDVYVLPSDYEGSIEQKYDEFANITTIGPEEEIKIDNFVNNISFEPEKSLDAGFAAGEGMDIKMNMRTPLNMPGGFFQPFEDQLDKARLILENERKEQGSNKAITKQEIEGLARQIIKREKIDAANGQLKKDYLEKLPNEEREALFAFVLKRTRENEIIYKGKLPENYTDPQTGKMYSKKELEERFDFEARFDSIKNSSLVKSIKKYTTAINIDQQNLLDLAKQIKEGQANGFDVTALSQQYNSLLKTMNKRIEGVNSFKKDLKYAVQDVQLDYSNYIKKAQEYEDDTYEIEWLKRNYSQMKKYFGGLGEPGDLAINSISYALGGLQQLLALIDLGIVGSTPNSVGLKEQQAKLLEVQSAFIDYRKMRKERYVKAPEFGNAFSSFGNFTEYIFDYGLELVPFYASMIGTTYLTGNPYAGIAVASSTTGGMYAGERFNEMLNGGRPYDFQEMNLTMTGYSLAEVAGTIPEFKILKGVKSRFAKGAVGNEVMEKGLNAWSRRRLNGLPEYSRLIGLDYAGEIGLTLTAQNLLDGKPMFTGFTEASFNTLLFSNTMYVSPIVAGGIYNALSSPKINAEFKSNVAEYNNIERSLYDNRFKKKVLKSSLTPEQIQQMKNLQLELVKSNENILLDLNKRIKEMDADGFRIYAEAMTRVAELQQKASEISNNSAYDFETKEALLKPMRVEFEALVNARNVFTAAFTKTFGLLSKSEQAEIRKRAIKNLEVKGINNPSEKQIYDESEQVHIQDKFERNFANGIELLKSLKTKGLNISFSLGRTNKQTIARYRKMLDARVKDSKNSLTEEEAKEELEEFIEGIEDGTMNGTTFVTTQTNAKGEKKLVYDVIVSQQNSVANQASETTFHELNHVIFSEALGTDSKAFEPVAASILDYLADNNFNAYLRITQKADTTKADEVIIAFLEELSGKRINIEKANNFNFWNQLAFGVNNSVKANNTDSKFNMDFSGPNGALQFFQTLADAWNNKELSVDALNKIIDSDVWQGEGFTNEEVVITAPSKKRSKLTPKGIKLFDSFKKGILTNKDLVAIVRKKPLNQEQRDEQYAAAEAIVEANFGFIKGKIGYERRGVKGIDENNIKKAIIEIIIGGKLAAWSNKTTPLFEEGEGYNPDFEVTTFLGRLGNRADIIYERAKDLGDVVFNTSEITDGIIETDVETETTPVKVIDVDAFKILKKPNKKVIVSSILEKIKTGEINLDSDITLKDLKPFAEAAAQQIADELGIPVSRILNPKDNLRKGEVTPIQMFIKNNAPALLSMIKQIKGNADILTIKNKNGKTIKVGGEGRKLGQKLLDAFYIQLKGADGKPLKVNNQIQYRLDPNKLKLPYFLSVFGMDAKGNIKDARSGTAQASKNIMELLSRLLTLNSIEIAIDQQVAEGTKTESEGARQKAQVKRSKVTKRNWGKGKFPVELPLLIRVATNVLNSKGVAKKAYDLDTAEGQKFVSTIKSFIEAYPELGDYVRRAITGGYGKTFTDKVKFDKYIGIETGDPKVIRLKYGTRKNGVQVVNKKAIQRLIDDPSLISKDLAELKKLFLAMQEFMVKNKDAAPDLARIISDLSEDMNSPLRYLAPTIFYPVTADGKIDIVRITEEHMMPAIQMGKQLFDAAIKGNVESEFKIIEKSYAQGALRYNDDLALKPLGLNDAMPPIFYETVIPLIEQGKLDFLPAGLASWIRYSFNNTANPFLYKLVNPKMTIGEFFVGKLNIKSETGVAIAGEKANELITKVLSGEITLAQAKAEFKVYSTKVLPLKIKAAQNIDNTFGKKVMRSKTVSGKIKILEDYQKAIQIARDPNAPVKGISVLDFDDTVAITNSSVIVEMPDGTIRKINATEFALEHSTLESMGAKFDFSEFNKVVQGRRGPLFDKLKKAVDKFGNSNVYILTARTPEAATAIHEWLKSEGITLKFENIVGLADGAAQAKANWIVGKAAEGYNDFYFADDALLNVQAVQAVYDVLDVKGRAQIALRSKQKNFDTIMNDIIEKKTGIASYKNYSPAKAKTIGASKGKFQFFIPPSAEDFTGLLYKLLGKGNIGDAQMAFFKDNLIDPYNRAEIELEASKVAASRDFNALKSKFPTLPKSLKQETGIGKFTFEHAIRAYIWSEQGMSIPGLSKRDLKRLSDFVKKDPNLKIFADQLISLRKGKDYPAPNESWTAGTITTDIISGINKIDRKQYLTQWKENVDLIFTDKVMGKLEAAFGAKYVEALKASIDAMYRGSNRSSSTDSITSKWYDWINNSVGVVMFLNTRSALLQMISNVNFINWKDNNPLQAAKAFGNQPQYWKDVMFLLNSPYLKARRDGLKINISESEIADLAKGKGNKAQKFIALALEKGFVFTRFADSFAIATGGATFYRNRYNSYIKDGMTPDVAAKQAFEDFRDTSETSQQSSNPMKVSQQQRSAAGRLILSFGNTQMQYARIQKRAIQDLVNGRGDWKENVSKIVYYGGIQNLMFNALQQGIQFLLFDGDEEKDQEKREKRIQRTLNGMIDSQLRGLGIYGALSVTLKNTLMEIAEQAGKKTPEYAEAVDALFSISPPLQSKLRKLKSAANTFSWNMKEMKEQGINLNNPAYLAVAQTISALTNLPVDEAVVKLNAMRAIYSDSSEKWQKVALLLGWSTWDVGLPYYGVEDKVVITPEMEAEIKLENMMKETTKPQQVETLLNLGLTKKQIKDLKYEQDRVKKIIELQNKKENGK